MSLQLENILHQRLYRLYKHLSEIKVFKQI